MWMKATTPTKRFDRFFLGQRTHISTINTAKFASAKQQHKKSWTRDFDFGLSSTSASEQHQFCFEFFFLFFLRRPSSSSSSSASMLILAAHRVLFLALTRTIPDRYCECVLWGKSRSSSSKMLRTLFSRSRCKVNKQIKNSNSIHSSTELDRDALLNSTLEREREKPQKSYPSTWMVRCVSSTKKRNEASREQHGKADKFMFDYFFFFRINLNLCVVCAQ